MSNEQAIAVAIEVEHAVESDAEHAVEVEGVCYSTRTCRCGAEMQLVDRDGARGGHWACGTCGRRRHRR